MIALQLSTEDAATSEMRAFASRIANLGPALDEIGASQVTEVQLRFERQHSADGVAWQPLAESTLARRKAGKGSKILRETGDNLYDTLTHKVDVDAVSVGVNRWWGIVHQQGNSKTPARPFLGLSDEGANEVLAILRDHAEGKS